MVVTAIGDTVYLYQAAVGSYEVGTILDSVWPASALLIAGAAWQRPQRWAFQRADLRALALPGVFVLIALALEVYDHFHQLTAAGPRPRDRHPAGGMVRGGLAYAENARMLRASRHEALTDGLSGLPNRRWLLDDLDAGGRRRRGRRTRSRSSTSTASSTTTTPSATRWATACWRASARALAAAVEGLGRAYRLGGDEFCVLLPGRFARDGRSGRRLARGAQRARRGLRDHRVLVRRGACPDSARDATHAMRLADERMYRDKNSRRASGRRQARDVLLQVLTEREPDLHQHLQGVARLALAVGRRMGLDSEELDILRARRRAARRRQGGDPGGHPRTSAGRWTRASGPSSASTRSSASASSPPRPPWRRWRAWCAPATSAGTAAAIRTGSPARRSRSPRGSSRVCDAFDAMTSDRPYREAPRRRGGASPSCAAAPARSSTPRSSRPSPRSRPKRPRPGRPIR